MAAREMNAPEEQLLRGAHARSEVGVGATDWNSVAGLQAGLRLAQVGWAVSVAGAVWNC